MGRAGLGSQGSPSPPAPDEKLPSRPGKGVGRRSSVQGGPGGVVWLLGWSPAKCCMLVMLMYSGRSSFFLSFFARVILPLAPDQPTPTILHLARAPLLLTSTLSGCVQGL